MATSAKPWISLLFACSLICLGACSDSRPQPQPQPQAAPQAEAGKDQTAGAFNLVHLDGSASKASNGGQLSYQWKQLNTNWVVVDGGLTNAQVSFYIPAAGIPAEGGEFELTVKDTAGNTHRDQVKILPEACAPSPGELLTNCLSLSKQPVQINNTGPAIKEGFGNSGAQLQWALIDSQDANHGKVLDVKTIPVSTQDNLSSQSATKNQNTLALQAAYGHPQDLSAVGNGFIEFDFRILSASADTEFFTGIGCLKTCGNQLRPLDLAQGTQWQRFKFPLSDYFAQKMDLSQVTQMLAITVQNSNNSAAHFQVDNIKWLAAEGGSIPADLNLAPSNPLQLGFPAPSGTRAKISAVIPGVGQTDYANGPISPLSWEANESTLLINRLGDQTCELFIDLSNSWGPEIAAYQKDYTLRLNTEEVGFYGTVNVSFGYSNGASMEFTNEHQIFIPLPGLGGRLIPEIPLSSFRALESVQVKSLRLRMTGPNEGYPIKITGIELAKNKSSISAAVNSQLKIGRPAQEGESYDWQQWTGTDLVLINNTKKDSAQIEFIVPGQRTSMPIILTRAVGSPDSDIDDFIVIYRADDCKLPTGVLYRDCLANDFGPLKVSGRVTFGTTFYTFPPSEISISSFSSEANPIFSREVMSSDASHAQVIDVTHRLFTGSSSYTGRFFIPLAEQLSVNWQDFAGGSLEFDINVIDYGDSGEAITVGSWLMEHPIPPQPLGLWQHISVPITSADLWLNAAGVGAPFAIFAPNQVRGGLHYQIDNIQFKKPSR